MPKYLMLYIDTINQTLGVVVAGTKETLMLEECLQEDINVYKQFNPDFNFVFDDYIVQRERVEFSYSNLSFCYLFLEIN